MNAVTLSSYALMIFTASMVGGIFPLLVPPDREHFLKLFVNLGAGLLLGMAFLHMIPEAAELLPHTFGAWLLFGFLILLVLERFVMVHACEEHGCHYHTVGMAAFMGLAVHGIIEGFALASSTLIQNLAVLVLVAILSHKAPAGFALTSILRLANHSKRKTMIFVTGVALSGPLGILLAYLVLKTQAVDQASGALLATSAGTFLYIGGCDLLPELHRTNHEKFKRLFAFAVGILISYLSGVLLMHDH